MFEALASFSRQARGSIFYNVPLSEIKEGLEFRCELEPFNARDENSFVLMSRGVRRLFKRGVTFETTPEPHPL